RLRVLGAALILLSAAACGGGGGGSGGTGEPAATAGALGAVTPVEGCGPESYVDPADLSPDRKVARCEAGAPAPQPLKEPTTIRMTSASRSSSLAPIFAGMAMGEFEKENLKIDFTVL